MLETIDVFKKKQGFETHKQVDDRTYAFDGFFFDIDDISFDIKHNVTPGRIKLYASEGTDKGKMPPYAVWVSEWGCY